MEAVFRVGVRRAGIPHRLSPTLTGMESKKFCGVLTILLPFQVPKANSFGVPAATIEFGLESLSLI
jgi:hypothetical protein